MNARMLLSLLPLALVAAYVLFTQGVPSLRYCRHHQQQTTGQERKPESEN